MAVNFFGSLFKNQVDEMVLTGAQKSARYYAKDRVGFNRRQTLQLAAKRGRVPRLTTLQAQQIDPEILEAHLRTYAERHPDTRAAKKIKRHLDTFVKAAAV